MKASRKTQVDFALFSTLALTAIACTILLASPAMSVSVVQRSPHVTIEAVTATAFEDRSIEGVFVISRTGSKTDPLTVLLSIGGSATNGIDYVAIPRKVQIPAGSSSVEVRVRPINDTQVEEEEIVTLGLAEAPVNSASDHTLASVVIKDNDTLVQISADIITRGSETGSRPVVFRINRTGDLRVRLPVSYEVNPPGSGAVQNFPDGTSNTLVLGESTSSSSSSIGIATSGLDFGALPGTITLQPGQATQLFNVTPIDDTLSEGRESVVIRLLPSPLYTVNRNNAATGFIEDNDQATAPGSPPAAATVSISVTNGQATEEGPTNGTVAVTRIGPLAQALTVSYSINDPSGASGQLATNGVDFQQLPLTVTIPAGASSVTIIVRPISDNQNEPPEQVVFQLLAPNTGTYVLQPGASKATVNIKDRISGGL